MKQFYLLSFSMTFLAHGICNDFSGEEQREQFQLVKESGSQVLAHQTSLLSSPQLGFMFNRNASNTVGSRWKTANRTSSEQQECLSPYHRVHVGIRHNEAKGIGYKDGYTTLEVFGISDGIGSGFMPFIDLRGHVFNDGKPAGNVGIGERSLFTSINHTFGSYLYYDVRRVGHGLTVNQLSPGIELVGERMEYRINGYFPLGKQKGRKYGFEFDEFKGHSIFLKAKQQQAMMGGDAEVGVHIPQNTTYDVYAAAGPYYFHSSNAHAWGGRARLLGRYKEYVTLEVAYSYDHLFRNVVQGSVALTVPFGGNLKRCGRCCPQTDDLLLSRAAFAPSRFEIPVVKKVHKKEKAIDPATGLPWVVWFVNNTSHSAGTFESPFPTLAQAQSASSPNDIIYVFPGNGTAYDASNSGVITAGLTMQNSQMLLGASTKQRIATTSGNIKIPSLASGLPVLTTTAAAGSVVTLANNNTVSGFKIQGSGTGNLISGSGISNFTGAHNVIAASGNTAGGVNIQNISGQLTIDDSSFSGCLNALEVDLSGGTSLATFNITNSTFSSNTRGVVSDYLGSSSVGTLSVSGCTFTNNAGEGIVAGPSNSASLGTFTVFNCTFTNNLIGILTGASDAGSLGSFSVSDSTFSSTVAFARGISIFAAGGSTSSMGTLSISDTSFSNHPAGGIGINLSGTSTSIGAVNISASTFTNNAEGGLLADAAHSCSIGAINVTQSTFDNNSGGGILPTFANTTSLGELNVFSSTFNNNAGGSISVSLSASATLGSWDIAKDTFTGTNGTAASGTLEWR